MRTVARRPAARTSRRRTGRRDRPLLNTNFTVTLEPPDSVIRSIGFCEVILPELPVRRPAKTSATLTASGIDAPWSRTGPRVMEGRSIDCSIFTGI